jgi:hypothetical protein
LLPSPFLCECLPSFFIFFSAFPHISLPASLTCPITSSPISSLLDCFFRRFLCCPFPNSFTVPPSFTVRSLLSFLQHPSFTVLPSFLFSFFPSFLPSFFPSFFLSFLPSFLTSFPLSLLHRPTFFHSFTVHPSFLPSLLPSCLPVLPNSFLPSCLP